MVAQSLSFSLAVVHSLRQQGEFPQRLLKGGMVRVSGRGVFQQVFDEEHVTWDALHRLDQEVVQGQLALVVPRALLLGGQGDKITSQHVQGRLGHYTVATVTSWFPTHLQEL